MGVTARVLRVIGAVTVATTWPLAKARADILQEPVATTLVAPTNIVNAGDGSGMMFVTEQTGVIRAYQRWSGGGVFLDLTGAVAFEGPEQGVLGLAFDPQYAANGFFYVYYTSSEYGGRHCGPGHGQHCAQQPRPVHRRANRTVDPILQLRDNEPDVEGTFAAGTIEAIGNTVQAVRPDPNNCAYGIFAPGSEGYVIDNRVSGVLATSLGTPIYGGLCRGNIVADAALSSPIACNVIIGDENHP